MCEIRPMRIQDYDVVYDIWMHTPGMGLNTSDDSWAGIEKYLKRNPTTSLVAICGGQIVGAIMAGHDGRRGYIYHTAVLAAYQRKGIATKLVDAAIDALRTEGINKVALVAFERNVDGNLFWEKMGFSMRTDLSYRNKSLVELERIET